ncbi:MAG: cupin domain-containing protein [Candidatus Taylorbacteria bacterium]|nr:cupin domain-containing protein [Candidatus Taylorbacteria bacterium]
MFIKDLKDCKEFLAGDNTILRELLNARTITDADFRYSLAHATLKAGDSSTSHALKTSEVYYILEGEGEMHIGEETAEVRVGQAIVIPPDARQYIRNSGTTDLTFLCIVDPAWRKEDEVVF